MNSVFNGDTWVAYRPGEDATYKDRWVSRDRDGRAMTIATTEEALRKNAETCEVHLKWHTPAATPAKRREILGKLEKRIKAEKPKPSDERTEIRNLRGTYPKPKAKKARK